eukprot:60128-Prymnesium_polylepis.1
MFACLVLVARYHTHGGDYPGGGALRCGTILRVLVVRPSCARFPKIENPVIAVGGCVGFRGPWSSLLSALGGFAWPVVKFAKYFCHGDRSVLAWHTAG